MSRTGGPLDELLPGLRDRVQPPPLTPVHGRVLEQDGEGERGWVLAVWQDPGSPQRLHAELRSRVEATFLAELSRPPVELREEEEERRFEALRLAVFPELTGVAEAVKAFGLAPVPATGGPVSSENAAWRQALAHLRAEAQWVGAEVADEPTQAWEAPIRHRPETQALEAWLRRHAPEEAWGTRPGDPFARLAQALVEEGMVPNGEERPTPDLDGLRVVERAIGQGEPGAVRWIPPLVFQGLCDLVAVAGQALTERRVEWAQCEPMEGEDLAPPPLVRMADGAGGFVHIPIGLEVMRWCIMPLLPGESVPPLADWVADVFGR